ncbi:MAG TPA: oxygen-independent coproporphyrinogen III oxidase [Nevskiaceae bacterium]|nr:oxygen-independent coproporphyrinogen III oxidase [Nevskiaceae bacterium]
MDTAAFDADLVRRYDRPGPRYTSYPTALQFREDFGPEQYREAIARSEIAGGPLSVYVHVPFCANPCYYCGCTRIITRQPAVVSKYLARIIDEIRLQSLRFGPQRPVEQLHLGGGTPTYFSAEQLAELMEALAANFNLRHDARREFSIEMDPRTAQPGLIQALAAMGFNRLSLGVQDFSPDVQRAVNRVQTVDDTAALIAEARKAGFTSVSVDLIYGLPLQTLQSFGRTLAQVASLRPDRIAAYSYAHLPERFKAQRQINSADLPDAETKLALLGLTVNVLTMAGYQYIGMDHFALPEDELAVAQRNGTLHRSFQGYSTHGGLDLIGLGLSSIGRVADTYSQNFKTLDRYYGALDAWELPVERGLRLSADDRARRSVIESIMCQGRVDFHAIEREHRIEFNSYFRESLRQLEPLQQDGLVRLSAHHLEVTPRGCLLLRAVAMPFDAYAAPGVVQQRYSKMI